MVALATGPHVDTSIVMPTEFHRFGLSDFNSHSGWILKRLLKAYPQHSERSLISWLRNIMYDNSSLFIATGNSVALFQITNVFYLEQKPIVIERFVFAKEGYINEALELYGEAEKWAKSQSADRMIVEEMSDVPHDLIREKLGRLFVKQQISARL